MAARANITQLSAEVGYSPAGPAQVSALSAEVGYSTGYADAAITQLSAEVAYSADDATARVSQLSAEIGWEATNTAIARVTQLFAEIARSTALPTTIDLTSISPDYDDMAGGVALTLTGLGFVAGMRVSLGGTAATNVVVVNATTLTCIAPAHAPGVVNVVATWPDGQTQTLPLAFTYFRIPPYQCQDRFPAQEPLS